MTFGWPISATVIGWTALALGSLAVLAYVLKMRRRRFEVPFSTLWQRVLREKDATSLWKRLKRLLSLALTLLVIALVLGAALDPQLGRPDDAARSVVILLDASASMKTQDAGKPGRARIDAAVEEARDLLGALGGGDAAMVMRMDGQTTPLSRFESDMPRLAKLVSQVRASDTPADLRLALGAAADALRDRPNPVLVLIGDGAYDEETLDSVVWQRPAAAAQARPDPAREHLAAIDLSGITVEYAPIGTTGENVGIVAFNARRYASDKTSYEVYVEVENFGKQAARRKLVLYNGALAIDTRDIELKAGERLRQIYPREGGGEDSVMRASLQLQGGGGADQATPAGHDAFALDDDAWALLPARRKQHVLLVTRDNLYLEGAMQVYDNIEYDKLTPEAYDAAAAAGRLPEYAAVVFDDHTPASLPPPPTALLYFHPQGEHAPFKIKGTLPHPHITQVDDAHPVSRWLVMSDVNFDESSTFALDPAQGDTALASSVRDVVMAARRGKDRKVVACGFSIGGTDLVLRTAFPLLLVNALDWFASDDADLMTTYATGTRARVPVDGVVGVREVQLTAPGGRVTRAPLTDGFATFYAAEVGVHRLQARDRQQHVVADLRLAANLSSPTESDIAPTSELRLGGRAIPRPEGFSASHRRAIWLYLVVAAVLLLCIEWITFNRRITV